jgi:hypothetical protein
MHDAVGCPTALYQPGHDSHETIRMLKKGLVSGADIIQARFSIRSFDETVFRTLAVAGEQDLTLQAIAGKQVFLIAAELQLLIGSREF